MLQKDFIVFCSYRSITMVHQMHLNSITLHMLLLTSLLKGEKSLRVCNVILLRSLHTLGDLLRTLSDLLHALSNFSHTLDNLLHTLSDYLTLIFLK